MARKSRKFTPTIWLIILAIIACGLALALPPDPDTLERLHISDLGYRFAILALLVPYGIVWYAAIYAFSKLHAYANKIKGFEDGKAFRNIMIGMGILATGLILPTATSLVLHNIAMYDHGFNPVAVIVVNYLGLVLAFGACMYLNTGSHALTKLAKGHAGLVGVRFFGLLVISLAAVYTYLVISYHSDHPTVYYLSTPLLITTFIIPALFTWFVGLLSAYEIRLYAKFIEGSLYRKALRQFSYGIVVVIASSISSQFINNTLAADASHTLAIVLLLDYAILAMYALGLILMGLGIRKMLKIENV